jgi:deoxyribodipyrimidine photo-lyase
LSKTVYVAQKVGEELGRSKILQQPLPKNSEKDMKRGMIWFRNDLRVTDHEPLYQAARECDELIAVYVFDLEYLHGDNYGSKKFGSRRVAFILESLRELSDLLASLGNGLLIRTGKPEEVLTELAETHEVDEIYAHAEVTSEEVAVEKALREKLPEVTNLRLCHGHGLYHPEDLPFEIDALPPVFTAFRKKCEKYASVRPILPPPESLPGLKKMEPTMIPMLSDLGFQPEPISQKAAIRFQGGERQARARLEEYLWESESLSNYKYTRNGLLGKNYSSKFSAWLSAGCITPRMIAHEVRRYESKIKKNVSTYWMIFELIWRDYFRFVAMKHGERLFYPGGIKGEVPTVEPDEEKWQAWKTGTTGVPFIDANMKELNETGFMSNRGRQNVASYLVKDLRQDWRKGAAYFEEKLIDYDVTSNWGNWAYVAGTGNDPRESRYFNMISQAKRYDEKGEYVKQWIPELMQLGKEEVHTPWKLSTALLDIYELRDTRFAKPVYVNPGW